jgi:serine protease
MKKTIVSILAIMLVLQMLSLFIAPISGEQINLDTKNDIENFVTNEIIVKFKNGITKDTVKSINSAYGLSTISKSPHSGFHKLRIPNGKTVFEMVEKLCNNPFVEYAEPNYIAKIAMTPNDPYFDYQWHLLGLDDGGIGMESAWDIATGSSVTVAVIDTGITAGTDLADTCFVSGYDFVNDDNDPSDDNGHGTHVAGTVAQSTNNNLGVCGVAFDACLMPVKVLDQDGYGTYTDIIDGINFAVNNGADIISMSLEGSAHSQGLEDACENAYNNGVTCVAASGNSGQNGVAYPAAYDDYVIAVGATRYDKTRAYYSNYGSSLDVVAPGGDIYVDQNGDEYADGVLQQTFDPDWGYFFWQGTSMATPHVSGVAALLYSNGVTTPNGIRDALESTAYDLGSTGWDMYYGYGLINAYDALTYNTTNNPPDTPTNPSPADGATGISINPTLSVDVTDPDGDAMDVSFYNEYGTIIGTDAGVISGGTASVVWSELSYSTTYGWYAVADDGTNSTTSSTWYFTTMEEGAAQNYYADSDINVQNGGIIGSYLDTHSSDNVYEGIIEKRTGPKSQLEHRWTINVDSGKTYYNFKVEAYHTPNNEGDDFIFAYSTDDNNYNTMLTVTKTTDDNMLQTYSLPNTLSGTVYIRVTDADQTRGNNVADTIYIDYMYIEGGGQSQPNNPPIIPSSPNPADGATDVDLSPTISCYVNDADGDTMTVSFYEQDGTPIGTDTIVGSGTASTTFTNANQYLTTYYWYVVADDGTNSTTSPTWSFTTKEQTPNNPPDVPSSPNPADGATGIDLSPTISCYVNDADGDTMTVSFYEQDGTLIGTDTVTGSGTASTTFTNANQPETTYYWYVVADDGTDSTTSPTWSFTTKAVTGVTVTSITPDTVTSPTVVDVTITGTGFQTDADVTFEGGSGPSPIASNIIVVDSYTITATITVKDGGPPKMRYWDVRVTNPDSSTGVLVEGFIVLP